MDTTNDALEHDSTSDSDSAGGQHRPRPRQRQRHGGKFQDDQPLPLCAWCCGIGQDDAADDSLPGGSGGTTSVAGATVVASRAAPSALPAQRGRDALDAWMWTFCPWLAVSLRALLFHTQIAPSRGGAGGAGGVGRRAWNTAAWMVHLSYCAVGFFNVYLSFRAVETQVGYVKTFASFMYLLWSVSVMALVIIMPVYSVVLLRGLTKGALRRALQLPARFTAVQYSANVRFGKLLGLVMLVAMAGVMVNGYFLIKFVLGSAHDDDDGDGGSSGEGSPTSIAHFISHHRTEFAVARCYEFFGFLITIVALSVYSVCCQLCWVMQEAFLLALSRKGIPSAVHGPVVLDEATMLPKSQRQEQSQGGERGLGTSRSASAACEISLRTLPAAEEVVMHSRMPAPLPESQMSPVEFSVKQKVRRQRRRWQRKQQVMGNLHRADSGRDEGHGHGHGDEDGYGYDDNDCDDDDDDDENDGGDDTDCAEPERYFRLWMTATQCAEDYNEIQPLFSRVSSHWGTFVAWMFFLLFTYLASLVVWGSTANSLEQYMAEQEELIASIIIQAVVMVGILVCLVSGAGRLNARNLAFERLIVKRLLWNARDRVGLVKHISSRPPVFTICGFTVSHGTLQRIVVSAVAFLIPVIGTLISKNHLR